MKQKQRFQVQSNDRVCVDTIIRDRDRRAESALADVDTLERRIRYARLESVGSNRWRDLHRIAGSFEYRLDFARDRSMTGEEGDRPMKRSRTKNRFDYHSSTDLRASLEGVRSRDERKSSPPHPTISTWSTLANLETVPVHCSKGRAPQVGPTLGMASLRHRIAVSDDCSAMIAFSAISTPRDLGYDRSCSSRATAAPIRQSSTILRSSMQVDQKQMSDTKVGKQKLFVQHRQKKRALTRIRFDPSSSKRSDSG